MAANTKLSLWAETAAEPAFEASLEDGKTVDLAIIGGGFTGLSTALHGARLGLSCQVLEAGPIGFGGSGRNAGLVNAGLWMPPQDVAKALGEAAASRLVSELAAAPAYVFELIEAYQIRCEAKRNGTIHAAHSRAGFENLRGRFETWQKLGAPVDLLSREEAQDAIGSTVFFGGLLDHRAGTINPMGYVRGLARAARAAGADIATHCAATKLTREAGIWLVETAQGQVSAKHVVIATNAYSDDLWPGLKETFTPIHYFQFATEPLGDQAAHILKGGQGLWDTNQIMTSVRRDADGRLIVGSMGKVIGGISERWAAKRLQKLFPSLPKPRFETSWHGQIAFTDNHLPSIHQLAEGLYTPIGYNGRGITTGTIFGKAMAALVAGQGEGQLPLPVTNIKAARHRWMKKTGYEVAFTANQLFKSL